MEKSSLCLISKWMGYKNIHGWYSCHEGLLMIPTETEMFSDWTPLKEINISDALEVCAANIFYLKGEKKTQ